MEFMADFPDDETCLRWLWNTRFNLGDDTAHCDRCGEIRTFKRYAAKQQRQDWTCTACGLHVHPTAGTIFHKSSTALHLWFYAMYLMTSTRCGISAKQLERELGVTYKTAWRMFTLIRNELMEQDPDQKLAKRVEMDETLRGWQASGDRPGQVAEARSLGPVPGRVVGARQEDADLRHGRAQRQGVGGWQDQAHHHQARQVVAYVVPKKMQSTVVRLMDDQIKDGATIYTDDSRIYDWMGKSGWEHHKCAIAGFVRRQLPHPHPADRRLLVAGQAWHLGYSPRRFPQVVAGVRERVRLAVQPPRRRPRDVLGATAPLRLPDPVSRAFVAWQSCPGHERPLPASESESPLPARFPVSACGRSIWASKVSIHQLGVVLN